MKRKLVYVGFGFLHHLNTHAGYNQIKNYLDYDYQIDIQSFFNKSTKKNRRNFFNRVYNRLNSWFTMELGSFPWYFFKCMYLAIFKGNCTFHFIYGENSYRNFFFFHIRGCKVVATFHQPFEWFDSRREWKKRLKSLDKIILVGNREMNLFASYVGEDKVVYIPHGISTDFYSLNKEVKKDMVVLTVGNWLRDYAFANKVYQYLLEKNPNLRIHIVSDKKNVHFITMSDRIKFMSNISDEELRQEYLNCSVLFLPLIRYTANNSLLEASSTGCNIVIASNYPDNSYIPNQYLTLVDMDVTKAVKAIENHLYLSYNIPLSKYIKAEYGWNHIAQLTKNILYNV